MFSCIAVQLPGRIGREGEYEDASALDFSLSGEKANPGLKHSADAVGSLFRQVGDEAFSSVLVTRSIDEELRLANSKFPGVKTLKLDVDREFKSFAQEYRLIQNEGAVMAIHHEDPLLEDLTLFDAASATYSEKREIRKRVQERTFRVPVNRETRPFLEPFEKGDDGLHVWKGDYDNTYGYWSGMSF